MALSYLKNGYYSLSVSPIGGNVFSFTYGRNNIFYPREAAGISEGKIIKRGGMHVCAPYFGTLEGYEELPRHGWLRNTELDLVSFQISDGCEGVAASELLARKDYPGVISATLTYELSASGLFVKLILFPVFGEAPLGLGPGFHPYFDIKGGCSIYRTTQEIVSIEKGDKGHFGPSAFAFPVGGRINIFTKSGTTGLAMSGDFDDISSVIIWSDDVSKYICVEPVYRESGRYVLLSSGRKIELNCSFVFEPF